MPPYLSRINITPWLTSLSVPDTRPSQIACSVRTAFVLVAVEPLHIPFV